MVNFMEMDKLYSGAYKKEITPKQLSQKFGYVNKAFFASACANTVSEKTTKNAAVVERGHVRHALKLFGRSKIKTSTDYFYVRDANGNVEPPKRQQLNLAMANALANGGR